VKVTWKTAILALALLLCVATSPAWATDVDYDEVDAAALPMAARTEQPQGADQFVKAYEQMLVYDCEEYGATYEYDNLVASVAAGAAVLAFDDYDDYGFWAGTIVGLAQQALGYQDGTPKFDALLSDCAPLAFSLKKLEVAFSSGWGALLWCLDLPISKVLLPACGLVASVGVIVGGVAVAVCAKAAAAVYILWCVLCFTLGEIYFWYAVLLGVLPIAGGARWRGRRLRERLGKGDGQ